MTLLMLVFGRKSILESAKSSEKRSDHVQSASQNPCGDVDVLSADADLVVRYAGGNNAGHTVIGGEMTLKLHLVPSGIARRCSDECGPQIGGRARRRGQVAIHSRIGA